MIFVTKALNCSLCNVKLFSMGLNHLDQSRFLIPFVCVPFEDEKTAKKEQILHLDLKPKVS